MTNPHVLSAFKRLVQTADYLNLHLAFPEQFPMRLPDETVYRVTPEHKLVTRKGPADGTWHPTPGSAWKAHQRSIQEAAQHARRDAHLAQRALDQAQSDLATALGQLAYQEARQRLAIEAQAQGQSS